MAEGSRQLSFSELTDSSAISSTTTSAGLSSAGTASQINDNKSAKDQREAKLWLDPEEYSLRKRLPPSLPKRNSDVYVTNKTHFKAQLNRCERIIDEGIIAGDTVACLKEKASEKPVLCTCILLELPFLVHLIWPFNFKEGTDHAYIWIPQPQRSNLLMILSQ